MVSRRVAIITGASSGLGAEFARQLTEYFAVDEIWLVARRRAPMEALAARLGGVKTEIIEADLQSPKAIKALAERLGAAGLRLEVLVNNAGFGKIGAFADLDIEPQLNSIDLNIRALTDITHRLLPFMQNGARIIQVASSIGYAPAPGMAVYAATKAYVLSFSYALRAELKARGIGVTAVCPGPVKTEFLEVAMGKGAKSPPHWALAATAEQVVAKALIDAESGAAVSVYGLPVRIFTMFTRLLPLGLLTKLVGARRVDA